MYIPFKYKGGNQYGLYHFHDEKKLRQLILPFIGQEFYIVPLPPPQPVTKQFYKLPLNDFFPL